MEVVLPALVAVFAARVKLTAVPLVTLTVRLSGKVAFNVTVPGLEFICAEAAGAVANARTTAIQRNLGVYFMFLPFFKHLFFLIVRTGRGWSESTHAPHERQVTKVILRLITRLCFAVEDLGTEPSTSSSRTS